MIRIKSPDGQRTLVEPLQNMHQDTVLTEQGTDKSYQKSLDVVFVKAFRLTTAQLATGILI